MGRKKRGRHWYGDGPADIRAEIDAYSTATGYLAVHFADAVCGCGGRAFTLLLDDTEGAAVCRCGACGIERLLADSDQFLTDAELEECACPCSREQFEVTVGVALYAGSEDVRWLYVGCRCVGCGLTAVYGDWKCEAGGWQKLLARV